MNQEFMPRWLMAFVLAIGLPFFQTGCTKGDVNLAITNEVIESSWKPRLRQELKNYYNEKAISSTSDPTKMALLVERISQLNITSVELERRGARTASWSISNSPDPVYVGVNYEIPGGSLDGKTSRRLKLILRGTNQISRVEFR